MRSRDGRKSSEASSVTRPTKFRISSLAPPSRQEGKGSPAATGSWGKSRRRPAAKPAAPADLRRPSPRLLCIPQPLISSPPGPAPGLVPVLGLVLGLVLGRRAPDAAEADMGRRAVFGLRMSGGRAIAAAVVGCAKVRTTLQHPARNPNRRLSLVVTLLPRGDAGIARNATGLRRRIVMARRPEIAGPLPDIADHVVKAVAVGRKAADRGRTGKAVGQAVVHGKEPLPGIGARLPIRHELLPPGIVGAVQAATRRKLPLRFRGQFLAGPGGVSLGILMGDLHHGMIRLCPRLAPGTVRLPPVRPEDEGPPLRSEEHTSELQSRGQLVCRLLLEKK